MKTQQEIKQLASKRFIIKQFIGEDDYNRSETIAARYGYAEGYTQCQEDMADKKYTEDDIKEAAYFFVSKKLAANQGILDEEIQEFINSLNKQD